MDAVSMFDITVDNKLRPSTIKAVSYQYNRLDLSGRHIQLLEILLGDPGTEICCQTSPISLLALPSYTALSYAWGNKPADCTISLNGHRVCVRKNLWRFLHQARTLGGEMSGLFWIDALCIDQSNDEERTHQVNLMAEIYSRTGQVLAWRGPAYGGSDDAMPTLAQPISYWRAKKKLVNVWTKPTGTAIRALCERPYWKRLWVFQELMLAQKIRLMCGGRLIIWEPFQRFLLEVLSTPNPRIEDSFEYKAIRATSAVSIVKQTAYPLEQTALLDLMRESSHLRCTETRDKVYALLGITTAGHIGVAPDYTMPTPTLLNAVLRKHHELECLKSLEQIEVQC